MIKKVLLSLLAVVITGETSYMGDKRIYAPLALHGCLPSVNSTLLLDNSIQCQTIMASKLGNFVQSLVRSI
jgi:hypothetical protein